MNDKITCQICGAQIHAVVAHLREAHPGVSIEDYKSSYPDAPLLSRLAEEKLAKARAEKLAAAGGAESVTEMKTGAAVVTSLAERRGYMQQALHEVFEFGAVDAAMSSIHKKPIMINVLTDQNGYEDLVPEVDENHVFDIALVKTTLMGLELNVPTYLWGHAGTGKTSTLRQICARTKRPFLRVQHTLNTEESHIVGQWTAKGGSTSFELGPLAIAMKSGLVYCADEYDMAMPAVLAVYQPVLEGQPLVIKEADHDSRIVRPHPNFRFVATGNTNGTGDETGLYQGTMIQNAANYERFGVVEEVRYMPEKQEVSVIMQQAKIKSAEAQKLVKFANDCRQAYSSGKIGLPISPRALINAAKMGIRRGDFKVGIQLSYANRLTRVDKATVEGLAQRIFG